MPETSSVDRAKADAWHLERALARSMEWSGVNDDPHAGVLQTSPKRSISRAHPKHAGPYRAHTYMQSTVNGTKSARFHRDS